MAQRVPTVEVRPCDLDVMPSGDANEACAATRQFTGSSMHDHTARALACAGLLVAGCRGDHRDARYSRARQAGSPTPPARSSATRPSAAPSCPGTDFPAFLTAYAEDTSRQARFTRFPLEDRSVEDNGGAEPQTVVRRLSRASARLPLMPAGAARAADSLQLRIEEVPGGRKRVVVYKPDMDTQIAYVSERGTCWELVLRVLLEYDRSTGRLLRLDKFAAHARSQAEHARFALEPELNRNAADREVVILEAASEEALRRTHRRYFEDVAGIASAGTVPD